MLPKIAHRMHEKRPSDSSSEGRFFVTIFKKKEGVKMGSFECEDLLLMLDDDLFPVDTEPEKESETQNVGILQ